MSARLISLSTMVKTQAHVISRYGGLAQIEKTPAMQAEGSVLNCEPRLRCEALKSMILSLMALHANASKSIYA